MITAIACNHDVHVLVSKWPECGIQKRYLLKRRGFGVHVDLAGLSGLPLEGQSARVQKTLPLFSLTLDPKERQLTSSLHGCNRISFPEIFHLCIPYLFLCVPLVLTLRRETPTL
jgi:hypothetical protein